MVEPIDDKIKRLKAELAVARQAHQLWDILIEKREKLEEKIAALKIEIEDEKSSRYREAKEKYKEIKSVENKKEALDTIKHNKQSIDEKLDDYEDFSDDIVAYLQNQLVLSILKKHPDQEKSYSNLDSQLNRYTELSDKLRVLITSIRDIDRLIEKVLEERKRAGPFRLLQFFFGKNPYFTISQSIQGIKLLCGNTLDVLHDVEEMMSDNHKAMECLEELTEILVQLHNFSQQRWSYSKIDKQLAPLKGTLRDSADQLDKFRKETKESCESQSDMINLWIEQHS